MDFEDVNDSLKNSTLVLFSTILEMLSRDILIIKSLCTSKDIPQPGKMHTTPAVQLVWDDILDFLANKVKREKMGNNTYSTAIITGICMWIGLLYFLKKNLKLVLLAKGEKGRFHSPYTKI